MKPKALVALAVVLAAAGYGAQQGKTGSRTVGTMPDTSLTLNLPAFLEYPDGEWEAASGGPKANRTMWSIQTTTDSFGAVVSFYKRAMDSLSHVMDSTGKMERYCVNFGSSDPSGIEVIDVTDADNREALFGFLVKRDTTTDIIIARVQHR